MTRNQTIVDGKKVSIKKKTLYSAKQKAILWIVSALFIIYSFTLLYPFVYLLLGSFKDPWEFMQNPLGLPETLNWENYIQVFRDLNIGEMFLNTITLALGNTIVSVLLSCMAAYVLAKYDFKGNKFVYMTVIVTSLIPNVAALPATYKLMNATHLNGTYIGMILLQCGAFGGTFLYLHAYFKAIPWSYAESAMVDGASNTRIFFKIMMPLARKGIMTIAIIRFLGFWNDYWLPSLFYEDHPTLAVGIALLSAEATSTNAHTLLFAAMIVSIIPVLIFFAIFQKQLMGNTIGGGLKE